MIELCRCPGYDETCTRAGHPMTLQEWELCSGNCPEIIARNPKASEQVRREWDRRTASIASGEDQFPKHKPGLGDQVESALKLLGITKEKVEKWLGRPCGCKERQEKLNKLGRWAGRILGQS